MSLDGSEGWFRAAFKGALWESLEPVGMVGAEGMQVITPRCLSLRCWLKVDTVLFVRGAAIMAQGGLAKFLVKRVPSPASPAAALQMSNCESSQPAAAALSNCGSSAAAALSKSSQPVARRPRTTKPAKKVTNAKGGKTKLPDVPDKKKKKDKDMMNEAPADDHCDDFEPLTSDGDMQGAVKEKGTEEQNNDDLQSVCGFAVGEVDYQVAPVPGIMDTTDHEMTDAKMPQAPMHDTYDAEINMWNEALEQKVPLRSAAGLRFA